MAKKDKSTQGEDLEQLTSTESFLERYKKILIGGGVAIVVIILAIVGYQKLIFQPHGEDSQTAYWQAFYDWQDGDTTGVAKNGTDLYDGFIDIADEYEGTKGGYIANYALATMAMDEGDYEGALSYFENCEFEDVMLGSIVIGLKGDCNVELGNYEEAAKLFEEAAAREDNLFTSPMYLKKAGLVYEELGQNEKAAELYEKIKEDYWESKEAQDIDKYIIRANN